MSTRGWIKETRQEGIKWFYKHHDNYSTAIVLETWLTEKGFVKPSKGAFVNKLEPMTEESKVGGVEFVHEFNTTEKGLEINQFAITNWEKSFNHSGSLQSFVDHCTELKRVYRLPKIFYKFEVSLYVPEIQETYDFISFGVTSEEAKEMFKSDWPTYAHLSPTFYNPQKIEI